MVSLGFSVQAELAHQNQERLPKKKVLGQRAQYEHVHCRGLSVQFPPKKMTTTQFSEGTEIFSSHNKLHMAKFMLVILKQNSI